MISKRKYFKNQNEFPKKKGEVEILRIYIFYYYLHIYFPIAEFAKFLTGNNKTYIL